MGMYNDRSALNKCEVGESHYKLIISNIQTLKITL